MTAIDAMDLLRRMCSEHGQATVARAIGYGSSTICQILSGDYGKGKSSPDNVLQRVVEVYGGLSVSCPIQGEIPLKICSEERVKPFAIVNSDYARQRNACRTCRNNPKGEDRNAEKP